jgi:hypothetical protein
MRFCLGVCVAVALTVTTSSSAQDVEPVPADVAQAFGEALVKAAAKIDKLQVKIEGDPAKSVGVSVPEEGGIILVPQKGIDEENTPDMSVANGVPLALYFSTPNIVPMIGGTLIDRGKLHGVTVTDDQGKEHEANCMLLTVFDKYQAEFRGGVTE